MLSKTPFNDDQLDVLAVSDVLLVSAYDPLFTFEIAFLIFEM
jgi:hypothetical protein